MTTIDGTDVQAVTIDGEDVKEITIDGEVAWLKPYSVPDNDNVDFELESYSASSNDSVDFTVR